MERLVISNIGCLVSGDVRAPLIDADALLLEDGKIAEIGSSENLTRAAGVRIIDANGMTITPGLIDTHAHPTSGQYHERISVNDWISMSLHGGVTTMISAGEIHYPGRPNDAAGAKALAIVAAKSYNRLRPAGVKVHAGAVILEPGLTEADFAEMAREGVWVVGEIGQGRVQTAEEAVPMVAWARKHGMVITIHAGGPTLPGSGNMTGDLILAVRPDVVSHINGGNTAPSLEDVVRLVHESDAALEIVDIGSPRIAVETIKLLKEVGQLHRLLIGTDRPSAGGFSPIGVLQTLRFVASMTDVAPEMAITFATGNSARVFRLDCGLIQVGKAADLVMMDAPLGSAGSNALEALRAGDVPAVTMVAINGEIVVPVSNYTPRAARQWSWCA